MADIFYMDLKKMTLSTHDTSVKASVLGDR